MDLRPGGGGRRESAASDRTTHPAARVLTLMHDEGVDRLASDPRTASVGGTQAARSQANSIADRLLAELRPNERAIWVMINASLTPQVTVLTGIRLLTFSVLSKRPAQVVAAPFQVQLGKYKAFGRAVEVTNSNGDRLSLILQPDDLAKLQPPASPSPPSAAATTPGPSSSHPMSPPDRSDGSNRPAASVPPASPDHPLGARAGGVPGAPGAWRWGRAVRRWQDAEEMAAAHMSYLGLRYVTVTRGGADNGLDVVAEGAAAQVKSHATATGAPAVQQLRGAADPFTRRLFYATGYTPQALAVAVALNIELYQFTPDGTVVAVNQAARAMASLRPTPPPERGPLGGLTFEARQNRAVLWAQQIQAATEKPISDRKRKGARQLAQREQALQLLIQGLAELQDSDNPLYKKRRKERTLAQAEKTLKSSARALGLWLR